MAAPNFDDLTRVLATNTSRRKAFKMLFSTAVAGVFGMVGLGTVHAASCKPSGAMCVKDNECCSYNCYYSPQQTFSGNCECYARGSRCNANHSCCSGKCENNVCK